MFKFAFLALSLPLFGQVWQARETQLTGSANSFFNKYGHTWGDFDGDGDVDLFLNGSAKLWMNRATEPGHMSFENVSATYIPSVPAGTGWAACFGDFNNDGKPDIYGGKRFEDFLLENDFPNAFKSVGAALKLNDKDFNQSINWADHNNDGWLDIYITHEVPGLANDGPHEFYQNDLPHSGAFIPRFPHDPNNPDAHIYDPINNPDLFGLADMNSHAYGLAWGDIDIDGDIDAVTGACGTIGFNDWDPSWPYQPHNKIYQNIIDEHSDGFIDRTSDIALISPTEQALGSNDWCTILFDYDNDGFIDLFIGRNTGTHRLWHNTGTQVGDFNYELVDPAVHQLGAGANPGAYGNGACVGDYDNDGDVDIYITSAGLYRNDGGGNFTLTNHIPTTTSISDASFIDYNDDGFLDLFNFADLFENPGNGNHWIAIELVGNVDKGTTKSAHYVKIRVSSGGNLQYREHRQFVGSYSQHMVPSHFGLGSDDIVDEIQISWPNGDQTVLENVAADQKLTIEQPCDLPSVGIDFFRFCLGDTVELQGIIDGGTTEWLVENGPAYHSTQFSDPNGLTTQFTPSQIGTYEISFGGAYCRNQVATISVVDSDFSGNSVYDAADLWAMAANWRLDSQLDVFDLDDDGSHTILDWLSTCYLK